MDFLKELLNMKLLWFLAGLILFIAEFINPGVILIFFGIGAWLVCAIIFFIDLSLNVQLIIFLLASVLTLVFLRKLFKRYIYRVEAGAAGTDELLDEFINHKATAETDISPSKTGKVSFRGTTWEAEADLDIPKGSTVWIVGKDSITLKVIPWTD
ncbi:MAG: NfeD family protein [Deltaproteobacteria bacterium]|nr:NfeD family protein [Deltaproteobacteria bacterium]